MYLPDVLCEIILVVVDTNFWYHATNVHPGNVSITFGTEFE